MIVLHVFLHPHTLTHTHDITTTDADNVVMIENNDDPCEGFEANLAREEQFVAMVKVCSTAGVGKDGTSLAGGCDGGGTSGFGDYKIFFNIFYICCREVAICLSFIFRCSRSEAVFLALRLAFFNYFKNEVFFVQFIAF